MKSIRVSKAQKAIYKTQKEKKRFDKLHLYDCPSCKQDLRTNSSNVGILCNNDDFFRTYRFVCKCGDVSQLLIPL